MVPCEHWLLYVNLSSPPWASILVTSMRFITALLYSIPEFLIRSSWRLREAAEHEMERGPEYQTNFSLPALQNSFSEVTRNLLGGSEYQMVFWSWDQDWDEKTCASSRCHQGLLFPRLSWTGVLRPQICAVAGTAQNLESKQPGSSSQRDPITLFSGFPHGKQGTE